MDKLGKSDYKIVIDKLEIPLPGDEILTRIESAMDYNLSPELTEFSERTGIEYKTIAKYEPIDNRLILTISKDKWKKPGNNWGKLLTKIDLIPEKERRIDVRYSEVSRNNDEAVVENIDLWFLELRWKTKKDIFLINGYLTKREIEKEGSYYHEAIPISDLPEVVNKIEGGIKILKTKYGKT